MVFISTSFFFVFQKIIEEVEEMLNNLPGVTSVHGRFYDLSSKYYRIIGNHASYYKDALRYLGCVDIKDLPGEKRHDGKQTGLDIVMKHSALISKAQWWISGCWLHRNREAGKGVHPWTGWTLRRRSLQLWRAGEILTKRISPNMLCIHAQRSHDHICFLSLQLMHPVLESLRNTDKQWLIDTLYAFNAGNVEKFQGFKSAWGQQVIHILSLIHWDIEG